ncbi:MULTISPECIES: TetR/AcrR family transcriptional regulator [Thermoanaerobacterium]|uniref:TetR family transcriptional regulator n=2 Tax=Thermoanaerobacterium TaxID=28895 RepID=W9E7R5_9THEO|nr:MULTISPECIES: TetR/AcrR family transcriptional regulator [Thermoanaerobacterium]AFK87538.1 transcriptional regulator, TetR family [Thermoanaerobacterium saccharolyticum JW/SL-YS485]ETO37643.1 TetR family transcriptional regulator [Thermoanaerobacterium aotearoense SCUT27]
MNKTKEKIFNAAIDIISQKGFYKATMDEIADKAGVAKGTLYYHFNSKDDILIFLIDEGLSLLKNQILEKISHMKNSVEKLREIIVVQSNFLFKYKDFVLILLSQLWGKEDIQNSFREKIYDYLKIIEDIIDEGIEEKLIERCDKKLLSSAFFGMISSLIIFQFRNNDIIDPEHIADSVIEYTFNGIHYRD